MTKKKITALLETGLSQLECRLFREKIDEAGLLLMKKGKTAKAMASASGEQRLVAMAVEFFAETIPGELTAIQQLHSRQDRFRQQFASSSSDHEKNQLILQFAAELGASGKALRQDRKALKRWFGFDAVIERSCRRISEKEYRLVFLLNRLGELGARALDALPQESGRELILDLVAFDRTLKPLLAYTGDDRVRTGTFHCLARMMHSLSRELIQRHIEESIITFIYRASLDTRQPVSIQNAALSLLSVLDPDSFLRAANQRLFRPTAGDDLFIRRKTVLLLGNHTHREKEIKRFIPTISRDISPHVRQVVPRLLIQYLVEQHPGGSKDDDNTTNMDIIAWLGHIMLKDPVYQVRAAAIVEIGAFREFLTGHAATVSTLFADHFSLEKTPFVLRTGLKTVHEITLELNTAGLHQEAMSFLQKQLPLIIDLHQTSEVLSVRRWAAAARETLLLQTNEEAVDFKEKIEAFIPRIKPGKSRRFPRAWLAGLDDETAGRVLSLVAGSDFSLGIRRGIIRPQLFRGDAFGFRFWRFLHEITTPSPDKRQGFSHLTGRNFTSLLRAPSATGSELTQTKVPGEPLYFDTESGWRPYLPLVDEFACCAKQLFSRKPVKIFTPEGTTEIAPPASLLASLGAWLALTFRFRHYAELRNWHEGDQSRPDGYITAMEKLGFRVLFSGFETPVFETKDKDPSVSRFFPATLPLLSPDLIRQIKHYFFSAYENTLYELGLFAGLLLLIFLYKHLVYSRRVVRARKKIRLVIGGWGTRGKSGVERLKAAVFEAVGHGFVNKTTGCEAMFLHAFPFGRTREMFLFRPYDKATIWEHHHLICMTAALKAKIFLWECMALTPSFVSILQKHWTRDDISTITNTYPDHEDIQGPAGINIPQVMTNFIPEKATLITSEEEMTPILTEAARTRKTRIECTGWLEAGLLTPDVLGRFPYEEHPSNVALVLRMAETVGIDLDFALREMADRVVPDIGALKVFPQAPIKQRRLEFVNGMSANERFATMSNWQRMGFASHTAEKEPGTVISTLVNNRADRITRSRMFADIIVNDLAADVHFLIGSNLSGLSGFIDTAWTAFLRKNTLFSTQEKPAEEKFTAMAQWLKIPVSSRTLTNRMASMVNSLDMDLDPADIQAMITENPDRLPAMLKEKGADKNTALEFARYAKQWNQEFTEYHDFLTRIRTGSEESSFQ
ncbi:MAG: hypothetical protein R6V54_06145 [Desulfobacteraceae bacterium]